MLSLSHTLASLPLGIYIDNPVIIFALAFILHLFLDTRLHWNIYPDDFKSYPFHLVALDVFGGLFIAWSLLGTDMLLSATILAAIVGGNLPDVMHAFWEFTPKNRRKIWPHTLYIFFNFHHDLQRETKNIYLGLISQVITIAVAIVMILI